MQTGSPVLVGNIDCFLVGVVLEQPHHRGCSDGGEKYNSACSD